MAQENKWLKLIKENPVKIGHWVGFEDLNAINNEWLKSFLFNRNDQTLLAHRGSYKTTVLSLAIAILMVLQPEKNIIFFRKTDTDVGEVLNQVTKILTGEVFAEMVKDLYGEPLHLLKSSGSEINTNLSDSTKGRSQLVGIGIGSSITGKHGDIIITDDISNLSDRISRAERERTKYAFMELQNIKNRGGRFINTGTPWHKEDVISLMRNVKKYDCYETGLMTTEEIKHLRESMTASLFAANYELKHISDEEAIFVNPQYEKNEELIYDGLSHIDAAYGGSDSTAFTIVKKVGNRYVAFGKLWNKHVDDCLGEIEAFHSYFRAGSVYNELNADKGYLAKNLRDRGLPTETYHEKQNKYMKIITFLRKNWNRIYFLESTDREYINMILDYTENAEHDDAPDSLASLLRVFERKAEGFDRGSYEALAVGLGRRV